MTVDKQSIGKRIERIRLSMGMNKKEFGKLFNATSSLVGKWEYGEVLPLPERLSEIAFQGQISVDELMSGDTVRIETIELFRGGDHDIRNFLIAGINDEDLEELQTEFELEYSDVEEIISRIALYVNMSELPETIKIKRLSE